ncbi:MAG: hypothetical protein JG772_375 [Dysgonamonadaceae bacterium]|jgi:hypothetical protein|nr:hypothetical protein [Dysgonamonadaceae bacterium]
MQNASLTNEIGRSVFHSKSNNGNYTDRLFAGMLKRKDEPDNKLVLSPQK